MKWLVALILAVLWPLQTCRLSAEERIALATLEWPPYIGSSLPQQGYVANLARQAFGRSEIAVDLHFMPWARVVAMTKAGKFNGYLPEYFDPSLHRDFLLSQPFPGGPLGFFKRKADPITWKSLDDLLPYRIGVVRGYLNSEEFDRRTALHKEAAADDLTNLRKLAAGRLDLVVMDKYVGFYLLRSELADHLAEIEFMHPVLEEKNLYLCIARNSANGQAQLEAFNRGLAAMRDDGTLAQLLQFSGF